MRRYTVIPEYDGINLEGLLKSIHDEFYEEFNIDLNSEKYWTLKNSGISFKELWQQIIKDYFGDAPTSSVFEESERFLKLIKELDHFLQEELAPINSVLEVKNDEGLWEEVDIKSMIDDGTGDSEISIQDQILESAKILRDIYDNKEYRYVDKPSDSKSKYSSPSEVISIIEKEFSSLPNHYSLYEAGTWLDAAFAIKCIQNGNKSSDTYDDPAIIETAFENIDNGKHKRPSCEYYPFTYEDLESGFCDAFKCRLMKPNNANVFDTDSGYTETVKGSNGNPVVYFSKSPLNSLIMEIQFKDTKFTRWSNDKMKEMENDESFSLEDRLLFYEMTDAILVRNAAYEFSESDIPLSEGQGLFWTIEHIQSVSWRLFLLYFYVDYIDVLQDRMINPDDMNLISKISPMWMLREHLNINDYARTMARGLVYVYFNFKFDKSDEAEVYETIAEDYLDSLKRYDAGIAEKMYEVREPLVAKQAESKIQEMTDKKEDMEVFHEQNYGDYRRRIRTMERKIAEYNPEEHALDLRYKSTVDYERNSDIQWYYAFLQRLAIEIRKNGRSVT